MHAQPTKTFQLCKALQFEVSSDQIFTRSDQRFFSRAKHSNLKHPATKYARAARQKIFSFAKHCNLRHPVTKHARTAKDSSAMLGIAN